MQPSQLETGMQRPSNLCTVAIAIFVLLIHTNSAATAVAVSKGADATPANGLGRRSINEVDTTVQQRTIGVPRHLTANAALGTDAGVQLNVPHNLGEQAHTATDDEVDADIESFLHARPRSHNTAADNALFGAKDEEPPPAAPILTNPLTKPTAPQRKAAATTSHSAPGCAYNDGHVLTRPT